MEDRVTIIGLGCVGTSIGLALRKQEPALQVMGHDAIQDYAREAQRMGAVNKTPRNLPAACEGAGMVILALPLPAVRKTLEVLGPHLAEGCVVTDTAALKVPVVEWAREHLPDHVRFVAGMPIPGPAVGEGELLVGPEAARADLFEGGLYCVTSTHDTDPEAVTLLLELARMLGARPLFLDPVEHDGLQAGVADLPALIAVALMAATVDSPGWMEMRKMAGYEFAALTSPAAADLDSRREAALLNRENLLRRLDMFLAQMGRVRQWLLESDERALEKLYTRAAAGRARWLEKRSAGTWEETPDMSNIPGLKEHFSQMLFGELFRRRPPREDD